MPDESSDLFAVLCEVSGRPTPAYAHGLPLEAVFDWIVVPYESPKGEPFMIDGVPVTRSKIQRLLILRQSPGFDRGFADTVHLMRRGKITAEAYRDRLEAVFRGSGDDATPVFLKAYDVAIRERKIRDYLPNRETVLRLAIPLITEGVKLFARSRGHDLDSPPRG